MAHQPVDPALGDAGIGQELGRLVGLQVADLRLQVGADRHRVRTATRLAGGMRPHGGDALVVGADELLPGVDDVDDRLAGEQEQLAQQLVIARLRVDGSRWSAGVQCLPEALQPRQLVPCVLLAGVGAPYRALAPPLDSTQVGQRQLGLHRLRVGDRVHRALRARDAFALEAAHDMGDRVDLPDVAQEPVAEPLARAGAGHKAGDVHELDRARHRPRRLEQAPDLLEPHVAHLDHADVGLDRAERVGGDVRLPAAGEGVEQGGLAGVGQPDDADSQHGATLPH